MTGITTYAGSPSQFSTSEIHQSLATESQEKDHSARNWAIGGLIFEVLFLGIVAVYVLSSISWYQNCL